MHILCRSCGNHKASVEPYGNRYICACRECGELSYLPFQAVFKDAIVVTQLLDLSPDWCEMDKMCGFLSIHMVDGKTFYFFPAYGHKLTVQTKAKNLQALKDKAGWMPIEGGHLFQMTI
jgi:hypothetical protein